MGNLQRPNGTDATDSRNRSREITPQSGICSRCIDGCMGNCEAFKAAFRGRELLYPGPYGDITAGAEKDYPVDYSHLNIQGYALGAEGIQGDSDHALFPNANTESRYGTENPVKLRVPIFTGALGSTDIARKNWEGLAVGAAISGITLVVGENVCGVDHDSEWSDGKVRKSPELAKRVKLYRDWREGYGDIIVQLNVEDTRFGVAEYAVGELGVETIELKWGQGAKCIGGEIKLDTVERALELQSRGYLITPDPSNEAVQQAFADGEITAFERHSRLGFVDEESFLAEVQRLRDLGAKRVTLKTGAYGPRELAMAVKWASKAKLDLLTIDGAPGGTGMSPWRMMNEWGVPTFYLQAMAVEFARTLDEKGEFVPDLAMAGGFSTEDHIYKVLAMGAPYFKAVCMGRALMLPGFVGKNIGIWHAEGKLPKTVSKYGSKPEEIFYYWDELKAAYGDRFSEIPLGAIGVYSFVQKLAVGLQQLMAGSRKFATSAITRDDVFSLTREAAEVSGIRYVMDAGRQTAMDILNG